MARFSKLQVLNTISQNGIVPVFYHQDAATCKKILKAVYDGGVRIFEFTNRGKSALANFRDLVALKNSLTALYLGVGTIRNRDQANEFREAGADFLVSPFFDSGVSEFAVHQGILYIPGCMTPTEIERASVAGCKLIKLFPGNVLGPGFVSAVRPLFPGLLFMPTGGVESNEKNLTEWFDAGVCAVGIGSNLISSKLLSKRKFDRLEKEAGRLLNTLSKIEI